MINKTLEEPLKIRKLKALLRRLPPEHRKRSQIEKELEQCKAGYRGAQFLDYPLSCLPDNQYLISHNLWLTDDNHHSFQLNTVLLSRFFILILDVITNSGKIPFEDPIHQQILTMNGQEDWFVEPLTQVDQKRIDLQNWILAHKFSPIPIETLIVISNPSTIFKPSPEIIIGLENIIPSTNLCSKIDEIAEFHQTERLTDKKLKKLSRSFTNKPTHNEPNILKEFLIDQKEIEKGVHCRKGGSWRCTECKYAHKMAHLSALQDYRLLMRPDITNQQLRDFLLLSSKSTARNLLMNMNLDHTGDTKGRKYWLTGSE